MANLSKEEKNALKKVWKAAQRKDYILTEENVKELFEVGDGLPVTVIVNKEGIIKSIFESSMSFEELENAVLPLLE